MKKQKIVILTATLLGIILLSIAAFVFFGTKPVYENKTIEVGTQLSSDAEEYLTGNGWLIDHATVDFSDVDINTAGEYQASCRVFFRTHKFTVNVVAPAFSTREVELGSKPDTAIATYLLGDAEFINTATLDMSGVNQDKIGKYEATVQIDGLEFEYEICVIDTTAPTLELNTEISYVAMMREYNTDAFVKSVFDLSEDVEVYFESEDGKNDALSFDEIGEETINLVARDSSGNISKEKMQVTVDIAPLILGVYDTYVTVGESFDGMDGMLAYDNEEGDITERVTVSGDDIDTTTAGEYTVSYEATDKNGLTTEKKILVYVCEAEKKGDYAYLDDKVIPQDDLMLLCETDYFSTKPLEQEDREKALELIIPASLRIGKEWENAKGFGSGFIYDITPEHTYILSVWHVVAKYGESCDLMFFDDTEIHVEFEKARANNNNELALIKVDTNKIPSDVLLTLKEAYVDEAVYVEIEPGKPAIEHSENWGFDERKQLTKDTKVITVLDSLPDLFDACCITTEGRARSGMSGCALIDLRGRVIGSASHIYKGVDYFMRIENLDVMLEKLAEM